MEVASRMAAFRLHRPGSRQSAIGPISVIQGQPPTMAAMGPGSDRPLLTEQPSKAAILLTTQKRALSQANSDVRFAPRSGRSGFPCGCLKADRQLCSGNEHRECPIMGGKRKVRFWKRNPRKKTRSPSNWHDCKRPSFIHLLARTAARSR